MNLFEYASRKSLRFVTSRGNISTEQLWDLPLTSKTGFDLDTLARGVNNELKATAEESFVSSASSNPQKKDLEVRLELIKHIIAVKISENEAKVNAKAKAQEREKLLKLLEVKEEEQLGALSTEEIRQRLAALDQ